MRRWQPFFFFFFITIVIARLRSSISIIGSECIPPVIGDLLTPPPKAWEWRKLLFSVEGRSAAGSGAVHGQTDSLPSGPLRVISLHPRRPPTRRLGSKTRSWQPCEERETV